MSAAQLRRRLLQDHASITTTPPADFFLPLNPSNMDDLTHLTLHLLGPTSTPYENGIFTLTLKIPPTYPNDPPKANFRTKIFHPNVDDRTGDVCVDTLKRDWKKELTLKDVCVTIRCLLIYPNPASALNEEAGKMLNEDFGAFEKRARLMTSVHAQIPDELLDTVREVRRRDGGDDVIVPSSSSSTNMDKASAKTQKKTPPTSGTTVILKKPAKKLPNPNSAPVPSEKEKEKHQTDGYPDSDSSGKENAPVASGTVSPSTPPPSQNAKPALGKRSSDECLGDEVLSDGADKSGRKSPKLNENGTAHGAKPVKKSTSLTNGKSTDGNIVKRKIVPASGSAATPGAKKLVNSAVGTAKKGLKRF